MSTVVEMIPSTPDAVRVRPTWSSVDGAAAATVAVKHRKPWRGFPKDAGLRRRRPAQGSPDRDVRLAELVCARMCHDLAGPVSAVDIGIGLVGDTDAGDDDRDQAAAIVATAAQQLSARLAFFRVVFSPAEDGQTMTVGAAVDLARRMLSGRRIEVALAGGRLGGPDVVLPLAIGRILLTLALVAGDALARGGRLDVAIETGRETRVMLTAIGAGASLSEPVRRALESDDVSAVSARTVHAHVAARLLDRTGASVRLTDTGCAQVSVEVRVPAEAGDAFAFVADGAETGERVCA